MGWTTVHFFKQSGVTLGLNIRFLKPVFVEQEIEIRCRIDSRDGDKVHLIAEITNEKGILCTRATGTYLMMSPERFKSVVGKD